MPISEFGLPAGGVSGWPHPTDQGADIWVCPYRKEWSLGARIYPEGEMWAKCVEGENGNTF